MSRSTAMYALALVAILVMGAGGKGLGAGDKESAARAATNDQLAVEKALDKQVSLKLKDSPLKETAAYLADLSGVNVLLDSKALADAGVAQELPITFELANVSLGAALRAMLAEHDLGYTIPDDNVLLISTAQRAKEQVVVRVYEVGGLISLSAATNEFADPASADETTAIVDVITSCVQPTSWSNSGGSSSIGPLNDSLVVSTNLEAHGQIAALLASLRKTLADERADRAPKSQFVSNGPAELKIREKLDSRQDIDFHETPLVELRDFLRAQGIPSSIDEKQLSDAGTTLDVPLSFKAKHVPLKLALRTMLESRGLGYVLRDEVLSITSKPAANSSMRIAMYPVSDLLELNPCPAVGDVDCDSLVAAITSTLAPTSWRDSGGEGSISLLRSDGVAVISQSEEIHEQIADMFVKMRAAKHSAKETAAAKMPAEVSSAMVVRVHHVASKEDAALDQYVSAIRNLIEPKTWTEGGGYIGKAPGAIVVRHTPAVQQRIKNLLSEIDGSGAGGGGLGGGGAFQVGPETPAAAPKPAPVARQDAAPAVGVSAEKTPVAADPAAAEQTPVERALAKRVKLQFTEMPLKDVANALAEMSDINVLLDDRAITDAGGSLDMPITFNANVISFREGLRLMLEKYELNFLALDDNVLQFTSDAKAKEYVVTRTYDAGDLAVPTRALGATELELDQLVDLISDIIAPTTWTTSGGTGSISIFETQLVVSQTPKIHEQIDDLLAALRQVRDEPQKYRDSGRIARPVSSAEVKILELLHARENFDFHEMPLKEFADVLRKRGIEVQLDAKALTDSGNSLDVPITFSAKHLRLETALKLMLQRHELDYIIDHEVLLITSDAKSKEHVVTVLYPIADLIPESRVNSPEDIASYESLIGTITSTVFPTTWDSAGGTGSIKPFPLLKILVTAQTQEGHTEIRKLLKLIRAQRSAQAGTANAQGKAKDERVTRFYRLSPEHAEATAEYLAVVQMLVEPKIWTTSGNYLGKVPGTIIARCPPSTHERIRELLIGLEALARLPGGGKGTGIGGGKSIPVVGSSGAF